MYTEASHILSVREIVICCNFIKDEWSLSFECYVELGVLIYVHAELFFKVLCFLNHCFGLCVGLEMQV